MARSSTQTAVDVHTVIQRGRRAWYEPTLAEQDRHSHALAVLAPMAFLAVGSVVDLVLIKPVVDSTVRVDERWSWTIAFALAALSVFAAFSCGWVRRGGVTDNRSDQWTGYICLLGWAAIGAALFLLRWAESDLRPAAAAFEGSVAAPETGAAHWLAWIMTLIYLATGAAAVYGGYTIRNDAATALRRSRRQYDNILARTVAEEKHYVRLLGSLDLHQAQLDNLAKDESHAIRAVTSLNNQLKAFARYRIVVELGDPAATGLVRDRSTGGETDGSG